MPVRRRSYISWCLSCSSCGMLRSDLEVGGTTDLLQGCMTLPGTYEATSRLLRQALTSKGIFRSGCTIQYLSHWRSILMSTIGTSCTILHCREACLHELLRLCRAVSLARLFPWPL